MPFANVVCIFVARLLHDSKRFSSTMGCHLFVFSFCVGVCVCMFNCAVGHYKWDQRCLVCVVCCDVPSCNSAIVFLSKVCAVLRAHTFD